MLKLEAPVNFQELVNFSDSSNLECFKCLERSNKLRDFCFTYQPHMFFEKTEVKQKWQSIINDFA